MDTGGCPGCANGRRESARDSTFEAAWRREQRLNCPSPERSPSKQSPSIAREDGSQGCLLRRAEAGITASQETRKKMSDRARIRVLCVDDHPLLREGITAILNNQPDMSFVAETATGYEAI